MKRALFLGVVLVSGSAAAQATNPFDTNATFRNNANPPTTVPTVPTVPPVQPVPTTVPGTPALPHVPPIALPPTGAYTPMQGGVTVDAAAFNSPVHLPEALQPHAGGLTADTAAQRALSGRYASVAIAEANLNAQLALRQQALRSLIPSVSTGFRYTRTNEYTFPSLPFALPPITGTVNAPAPIGPVGFTATIPAFSFSLGSPLFNQYDANFNVTIPLSDIVFRLYPMYEAADRMAEAARLNLEGARDQAGLEARQGYYEYLRAYGQALLADENVAATERHLAEATQSAAAGTVARSDLLRIHSQLADVRRLAIFMHGNVELAEAVLRQRLRMSPQEPIVIGEALDQLPPEVPDVDALIRQAAHERPEIRAISAQMRSVESNISAIRATQFPSVAVAGNFDIVNPNTRVIPLTDRFDTTWDVSINVRWNLTQAIIADAQIDQFRANRAVAEAQQQQLREGVEIAIRQLAIAARVARETVQASRVALASAEESLRVQHERMNAGALVASALADAENEVLRQRLSYINAVLDFRVALAQLDRQVGQVRRGPSRP